MYNVSRLEKFSVHIHTTVPSVIKNCLGTDVPAFDMMFTGNNEQLNQLVTKLMSYADEPVDVFNFIHPDTYGLFCDRHRRKLVMVDMNSFSVFEDPTWREWWNTRKQVLEQETHCTLCEEDADALDATYDLLSRQLKESEVSPFPFSMFKRCILKESSPSGDSWLEMIGERNNFQGTFHATLISFDAVGAMHLFGINSLLKE